MQTLVLVFLDATSRRKQPLSSLCDDGEVAAEKESPAESAPNRFNASTTMLASASSALLPWPRSSPA